MVAVAFSILEIIAIVLSLLFVGMTFVARNIGEKDADVSAAVLEPIVYVISPVCLLLALAAVTALFHINSVVDDLSLSLSAGILVLALTLITLVINLAAINLEEKFSTSEDLPRSE